VVRSDAETWRWQAEVEGGQPLLGTMAMAEGTSRGRPGYLLLLTLESFPKLESVDAMAG
jgi:hypothetical protein